MISRLQPRQKLDGEPSRYTDDKKPKGEAFEQEHRDIDDPAKGAPPVAQTKEELARPDDILGVIEEHSHLLLCTVHGNLFQFLVILKLPLRKVS